MNILPTLHHVHDELSEKPLRFIVAATSLLSLSLLTACKSNPVVRQELIGSYRAQLEDKDMGTTCFVLHDDGTYSLGDPQPKEGLGYFPLPHTGDWQLHNSNTGQQMYLSKTTLPIERKRHSIRIDVDDDLGYSCDLAITK